MVVNNLCEYAFMNALEYYNNECEFMQISIGTGLYQKKYNKPKTILSWMEIIINMKFNITTMYENMMIKDLVKNNEKNEYYRLDFKLEQEIKLDDYTAFPIMDDIFNKWLNENKEHIDNICSKL